MSKSTAFRVEVTVRVVPLDTNLPVEKLTAEVEGDTSYSGAWRLLAAISAGDKANRLTRRAFDRIYGEELI